MSRDRFRSPRLAIAALVTAVVSAAAAETARFGVDQAELMRVVRTLSAPSLEGRRTGTDGGRAARRFIRDAFRQIGLTPAGEDFLQPFRFVRRADSRFQLPGHPPEERYDDAANIVGYAPGTRPTARPIVLTAHYDHLGQRDGVMYPGADDNASGVAALLAVARYVRAHPLARRVIFAALDGEEEGLEGAKAFLRAPPVPVSEMALNVNLDMVSRNDRHEIFAAGIFHNPSLKPIVEDVQRRSPVKIRFGHDQPRTRGGMVDDWTLQSDHGVFHQAGVPFIYFGVEDHPDYHRPTDTADKIDPGFFARVVEMLIDTVITADARLP